MTRLNRCFYCDDDIEPGTEKIVKDGDKPVYWCGECDMSGLDADEEDEEDAAVWGDDEW